MTGSGWTHLHGSDDLMTAIGTRTVELDASHRIPVSSTARFRNAAGDLEVEVQVDAADGRPTVTSLTVHASDSRGVDRDRLRAIPVGDLLRRCVGFGTWVLHPERGWVLNNQTAEQAARRMSPTGRPLADQELAEVARVYREHEGPAPTQAVAARFHLSDSGAAKRVGKARRAGLLPPTVKGRATNRANGEV